MGPDSAPQPTAWRTALVTGGGGELRLFVIWPSARAEEDRILRGIAERFTVRSVTEVVWTPARNRENYLRFHGERWLPPHANYLEQQRGRGPFLVITATDLAPRNGERVTTDGPAVVSANLFEVKQQVRPWAGGGRPVHCTDSLAHATRDLMLLLGVDPDTHLRQHPGPWDGSVPRLHRDVTGANGWDSLEQVFYALNHTVPYVVLRNFESLPHSPTVGPHDDVDVLTDRYRDIVGVLRAQPLLRRLPRWGGRFWVTVERKRVVFDLRFVGDRYYDPRWAREILNRRVWCERGLYVPNPADYFETLVYHAIAHKRVLSAEYRDRLSAMAVAEGRTEWSLERLGDPAVAHTMLRKLVADRGYAFVPPRDVTVYFNYAAAGCAAAKLRQPAARVRRLMTRYGVPLLGYPLDYAYRTVRTGVGRWLSWLRGALSAARPFMQYRRWRPGASGRDGASEPWSSTQGSGPALSGGSMAEELLVSLRMRRAASQDSGGTSPTD